MERDGATWPCSSCRAFVQNGRRHHANGASAIDMADVNEPFSQISSALVIACCPDSASSSKQIGGAPRDNDFAFVMNRQRQTNQITCGQ